MRWKKAEKRVALELWPGHPLDDLGSVRDHTIHSHDVSGPGNNNNWVWVEVKNYKWSHNAGGMWTILDKALDQLCDNSSCGGIYRDDDIYAAVYIPKNASIKDAICYIDVSDLGRIAMPICRFKALYCGQFQ